VTLSGLDELMDKALARDDARDRWRDPNPFGCEIVAFPPRPATRRAAVRPLMSVRQAVDTAITLLRRGQANQATMVLERLAYLMGDPPPEGELRPGQSL
jgi:hypothetical protein